MNELVEVIYFYRECKEDEISEAIMFDFDKSKYLKEIAMVANGNIIRLNDGYFAERKFITKEEAKERNVNLANN